MVIDTGTIRKLVEDFVAESPENDLALPEPEPVFDHPLVGYSSGADPLYKKYVSHIGPFYLTPADIFTKSFPDEPVPSPEELTVISWILPSTAAVRTEQAAEKKQPSERWIRVRFHGEKFNEALRAHVVDSLAGAGIKAAAPMLAPFWSRIDQGPYAPCSNWSERHAAYAAGLGTFGLCDGLITPVGKAMRAGSVVARITLEPTPRPYEDHHAYCLHYSHGTCGKCIDRCPVNAISREGHDKQICMKYTEFIQKEVAEKKYGIVITACGLCQAPVPCMAGIPDPDMG